MNRRLFPWIYFTMLTLLLSACAAKATMSQPEFPAPVVRLETQVPPLLLSNEQPQAPEETDDEGLDIALTLETGEAGVAPAATPGIPQALTVVAFPSGENKVILLRETHPDGTAIKPGMAFTKEWELKNTGSNMLGKESYLELQEGAGGQFGAPQKIVFGTDLEPGESLTLKAEMTAPEADGNYTVKYRILDEEGEDITIGGGNSVWLQVNVGENQVAGNKNIYNPDLQNVSFRAGRVEGNETETRIQVCASFNTRDFTIHSGPYLILDGVRHRAVRGGDDWLIGGYECFMVEYNLPLSKYEAANSIQISYENTRVYAEWGGLTPKTTKLCEEGRAWIRENYAGLDFSCQGVIGGPPYSALQVPSGMSRAEAERIVLDAIEKAVYVTTVIHVK